MGVPPMAHSMPAEALAVAPKFFSQGLQGLQGSQGPGMRLHRTGSLIDNILYMDDTMLMGRTKTELEQLVTAYVNFCNKFRMRINQSKSKTFVFTRGGTAQHDLQVGGMVFTPPDNKMIKYLGFMCDPNMRGHHHMNYCKGKVQSGMAVPGTLGKVLGYRLANKYINTVVRPKVMYNMEIVGKHCRHREPIAGKNQ